MEAEYEHYNKNIDEFDARNIFEFDSFKELNKKEQYNTEELEKLDPKKIRLLREESKFKVIFN